MEPHNFEKFLDQQRARGALQGEGRFTMDASRARLKLGAFQLDTPGDYLLKLVQAAVEAGCERICIGNRSSNVWVRFQKPKVHWDIDQIHALSENPERGSQVPGLSRLVEGLRAAPVSGVRFTRPGSSLDLLMARSQLGPDQRAAEHVALQRCRLCPIGLSYDGIVNIADDFNPVLRGYFAAELRQPEKEGRSGLAPRRSRLQSLVKNVRGTYQRTERKCWDALLQKEGSSAGTDRWLAVLPDRLQGPSLIYPVQYGVMLASVSLESCPGVRVYLCLDDLDTDLSGLKLREPIPEVELGPVQEQIHLALTVLREVLAEDPSRSRLRPSEAGASAYMTGMIGFIGGLVGLTMGPVTAKLGLLAGGAAGASLAGTIFPSRAGELDGLKEDVERYFKRLPS